MPRITQDVKHVGAEFHVTGVVESHSAAPLCSEKADVSAKIVNVARNSGGGIAYDLAIFVDDQSWRDREATDAEAMRVKQEQDAVKAQADADAAALKAKADAQAEDDARIAKIAAAVVKEQKS
jgi:hypothetical protein